MLIAALIKKAKNESDKEGEEGTASLAADGAAAEKASPRALKPPPNTARDGDVIVEDFDANNIVIENENKGSGVGIYYQNQNQSLKAQSRQSSQRIEEETQEDEEDDDDEEDHSYPRSSKILPFTGDDVGSVIGQPIKDHDYESNDGLDVSDESSVDQEDYPGRNRNESSYHMLKANNAGRNSRNGYYNIPDDQSIESIAMGESVAPMTPFPDLVVPGEDRDPADLVDDVSDLDDSDEDLDVAMKVAVDPTPSNDRH
jgi:hypothetical protein